MKLLAFLLLAALPAFAEEKQVTIPGLICRGEFCLVPSEVLDAMIEAHNTQVDEIRELKKGKPAPKCAETEITEPSKNPAPKPMLKRERDL